MNVSVSGMWQNNGFVNWPDDWSVNRLDESGPRPNLGPLTTLSMALIVLITLMKSLASTVVVVVPAKVVSTAIIVMA